MVRTTPQSKVSRWLAAAHAHLARTRTQGQLKGQASQAAKLSWMCRSSWVSWWRRITRERRRMRQRFPRRKSRLFQTQESRKQSQRGGWGNRLVGCTEMIVSLPVLWGSNQSEIWLVFGIRYLNSFNRIVDLWDSKWACVFFHFQKIPRNDFVQT